MSTNDIFDTINQYSMEEYFSRFGEIENRLQSLEDELKIYTVEQRNAILKEVDQWSEQSKPFCRIHLLSFCMKVSGDSCYTEKLLKEVLKAEYNDVGEYSKLSHFEQISTAVFQHPQLGTAGVELLLAKLYKELVAVFMQCFSLEGRNYIPIEERNKSLVFVFINQVLGMNHAPTKTLLDRCYVLKKILGKEVYIVNTAMMIPAKGQAPFYGLVNASYNPEFTRCNELEFRGEHFRFHQCSSNMPDLEEIANLICLVIREKPYYLLDIGGADICADLCGLFTPQITISTVFSKIAMSCGEYQIVDKELNEDDCNKLKILGVEPEKVIRTMFTFSFKEQTHCFTRENLGLPRDRFILLVVGWRLDEEVDDEFLEMLEHTVKEQEKIVVAFMGRFTNFAEKMVPFPVLRTCAYNLGEQSDALAVIETCDLYVNPRRNGGGSSVAEALYKGLPVVTLPIGDVSVAAGVEFQVKDYTEMKQKIIKYCVNSVYYEEMSQKAVERAMRLLDSGSAFGNTVQKLEELF